MVTQVTAPPDIVTFLVEVIVTGGVEPTHSPVNGGNGAPGSVR